MAKQRYVKDSFWTDPYVETLDPSEKLLFLYFLTNPLCNVAGIYEVRNSRVAYETGFDKEMIERIKQRFVKDGKMMIVDNWVILVNFVKNQSTNPSVLQGIQRVLDNLPEAVVKEMTACIQAGGRLSYLTLLNLTLPNSTLPTGGEGVRPPEPEEEKKEDDLVVKQIPSIIHAMSKVDPKNKKFYANKTQREACEFLITEYGFEKTLSAIDFIISARGKVKYLPTITTPVQLVDKFQQLLGLVERKQVETNKIYEKVGNL